MLWGVIDKFFDSPRRHEEHELIFILRALRVFVVKNLLKDSLNLLHGNIQGQNPVSDLPRRHIQQAGGFGLYPAALLQRGDDPFPVVHVFIIKINRGRFLRFMTDSRADFVFQAGADHHVAVDDAVLAHDRGAFQPVCQFADVAGPVVLHQYAYRAFLDFQRPAALLLRNPAEQEFG